MTQPLLDIQDLEVGFRIFEGHTRVLNRVNLQVFPKEKIGLVGEMGCGKTTTMKAALRLLPKPPAEVRGGKIFFKGEDLLSVNRSRFQNIRRECMSMIFEDSMAALNPVYTIGDQMRTAVKYSGKVGKRPKKAELQARAIRALEEVALPDPERILTQYPIQLSGGMRQRVCVAMALLSASDLLIADEPDTALDVTIKDQVLRLLDDLVERKGTSIILITHSLGAVRRMTDRVYVMYAGNIVEVAPTKELFANPCHPYTRALIESAPRLTGGGIGKGIQGHLPDYIAPPSGCRFHPRCSEAKPECSREMPPMNEVSPGHFVACSKS